MSLPNFQPVRLLAAIGLLLGLLTLSACSFAPVYGGSNAGNYDLAFDDPNSRLEQIVYQELVSHFGHSSDPNAPLVHVSVSGDSIRPGQTAVSLTGSITVTRPDPTGLTEGTIIYRGTRAANASYQSPAQSLARQQAANEAAERAAKDLAESIRLALLGALSENSASMTTAPGPVLTTQ